MFSAARDSVSGQGSVTINTADARGVEEKKEPYLSEPTCASTPCLLPGMKGPVAYSICILAGLFTSACPMAIAARIIVLLVVHITLKETISVGNPADKTTMLKKFGLWMSQFAMTATAGISMKLSCGLDSILGGELAMTELWPPIA